MKCRVNTIFKDNVKLNLLKAIGITEIPMKMLKEKANLQYTLKNFGTPGNLSIFEMKPTLTVNDSPKKFDCSPLFNHFTLKCI